MVRYKMERGMTPERWLVFGGLCLLVLATAFLPGPLWTDVAGLGASILALTLFLIWG